MKDDKLIKLEDIFNYSFYDDDGNYTFVLNEKFLKEQLGADVILLQEYDHK